MIAGPLALFGACSSSTTNDAQGSGGSGTGGANTGGASTGGASTGGNTTGGNPNGGGAGVGGAAGAGGVSVDAGFSCPAGGTGPILLPVGNFCIDETEVTNAQYATFLGAVPLGTNITPLTACDAVTDYTPDTSTSSGCPPFAAGKDVDYPVRCVNWCSAYAYCKWAGKRLCGAIPTGSSGDGNEANPATNQWFAACAGPTALDDYPYGPSYEPKRCADVPALGAVGVKTKDKCVSFSSGAFGMSGNVREWEDSCSGSSVATAPCRTRGGSYNQAEGNLKCSSWLSEPRDKQAPEIGFRCCWDPSVKP